MISIPTDVSANEEKLQKLDQRDKLFRAVELFILTVVIAINLLLLIRTQSIVQQNQSDAVAAREHFAHHQEESTNYIKCILLLRYDHPELNPQSPREEVEAALDQCVER